MAVRDVDNGYGALVKRIFALGAPKITIGIHEADGAQEHDGLSVVALAAIHEFGIGVPERSFIRAWFDENEERAKEALRLLLVGVVEGKRQPTQALELFALWAVGEIQARMARGIAPALNDRTIKMKGSSVPLIDTGQLRSSISYEILDENGSLVKRGDSDAAVSRHKKALAEKRDAKKADRAEARARARERKAIRKEIGKKVDGVKKDVEKKVSRTVKDAQKRASRLEKRANRAISRAGKNANRAVTRTGKKAVTRARKALGIKKRRPPKA